MNAQCPSCRYVFTRSERSRLLGGLWTPQEVPCPQCNARLRWVTWAWRLQLLAGVSILVCIFYKASTTVRAAFGVGALVLIVIAVLCLRLEVVESPEESDRETP